jgi:hypothetical protein
MRRVLAPPDWATSAIQAYYDCSEVDIRLKGMLLSVRAIDVEESGDVSCGFRVTCWNYCRR